LSPVRKVWENMPDLIINFSSLNTDWSQIWVHLVNAVTSKWVILFSVQFNTELWKQRYNCLWVWYNLSEGYY
jgi:hypothetical protein